MLQGDPHGGKENSLDHRIDGIKASHFFMAFRATLDVQPRKAIFVDR